ncbi:helix-turn-helix domain-containing protein [Lactococcus insecticola]|uniref:HTH cro/C1-type domain-containing protein n=1 Tax=Pseudolactococcus insecticola TaxID=2709158 RepID=A0A6A0B999_9LACT|nr:helix-turn-helix domain-containing protein [Lactococcus insecticola]GFH41031.1 hypothetical protein Hs20B_14290 [Lactococcus insecticola]
MAQKTVGQVLRDKRAKLDLTLNEVEDLTKIQKTYIVALEHDDYEALPGDFYVKAYLKQYADRLQIDYDKLIKAYENGETIEVRDPNDFSENYRFVKPSERDEMDENGEKTFKHYLPIALLGSVAVLIVLSVSLAVFLNKPKNDSIAANLYSVSSTSSQAASSEKPAASTPAKPTTEITVTGDGQALVATVKNAPSPVKVSLSAASGASIWIGMTNADLPTGQITLTDANPTTTTLTDAQSILTLGRTSGLTVKIGDSTVDLTGIAAPESPATLTINIE